ncbi:endonuclease [Niameybacter massiliensis]|uniref:Endonuclease n=1 Tax=Holtiella tumoricola TaxID=3018743 RepID=A0AA42J136_9FIRM|nr:endonuclease [Holtiella tumoricola]MDA3732124.1 endonuclease [Holtiella tumoricola]
MINKIKGVVTGVYKIEDVITGEVYVGSAKGIAKRWSNNMARLRKGTHPYFQEAWNDDPNRIKFEILEVVANSISDEDLAELEMDYFNYVKRVDGWTLVNKQQHKAGRHKVADTSKMKQSQAGIRNGNAKIKSEDDVRYIRETYNSADHGVKRDVANELAEKYMVSVGHIIKIANGQKMRGVE